MRHRSPPRFALLSLAAIILVTVAWWAAALWPLPSETPEWVARARTACFGSTSTGMPNAGGWILLIGTPLSLTAALITMAPKELQLGIRALRASRAGRSLMMSTGIVLLALAAAAGLRVSFAYGWTARAPLDSDVPPRRLAEIAPDLPLIDHRGEEFSLTKVRGKPVIVTFAFGKCETVCPTLVHAVLAAAEEVDHLEPSVVIVSLDPWRDTPSRLPQIAQSWQLPEHDAYVLSGDVTLVEETLDNWGIERSRDPRTGDIAHPTIAYILDREGNIGFVTAGRTSQIVEGIRLIDQGRIASRDMRCDDGFVEPDHARSTALPGDCELAGSFHQHNVEEHTDGD